MKQPLQQQPNLDTMRHLSAPADLYTPLQLPDARLAPPSDHPAHTPRIFGPRFKRIIRAPSRMHSTLLHVNIASPSCTSSSQYSPSTSSPPSIHSSPHRDDLHHSHAGPYTNPAACGGRQQVIGQKIIDGAGDLGRGPHVISQKIIDGDGDLGGECYPINAKQKHPFMDESFQHNPQPDSLHLDLGLGLSSPSTSSPDLALCKEMLRAEDSQKSWVKMKEMQELERGIIETFMVPEPFKCYANLGKEMQSRLKAYFKRQNPPCPSCGLSDSVKFRYFNNQRSGILQPRYLCRNYDDAAHIDDSAGMHSSNNISSSLSMPTNGSKDRYFTLLPKHPIQPQRTILGQVLAPSNGAGHHDTNAVYAQDTPSNEASVRARGPGDSKYNVYMNHTNDMDNQCNSFDMHNQALIGVRRTSSPPLMNAAPTEYGPRTIEGNIPYRTPIDHDSSTQLTLIPTNHRGNPMLCPSTSACNDIGLCIVHHSTDTSNADCHSVHHIRSPSTTYNQASAPTSNHVYLLGLQLATPTNSNYLPPTAHVGTRETMPEQDDRNSMVRKYYMMHQISHGLSATSDLDDNHMFDY